MRAEDYYTSEKLRELDPDRDAIYRSMYAGYQPRASSEQTTSLDLQVRPQARPLTDTDTFIYGVGRCPIADHARTDCLGRMTSDFTAVQHVQTPSQKRQGASGTIIDFGTCSLQKAQIYESPSRMAATTRLDPVKVYLELDSDPHRAIVW